MPEASRDHNILYLRCWPRDLDRQNATWVILPRIPKKSGSRLGWLRSREGIRNGPPDRQ